MKRGGVKQQLEQLAEWRERSNPSVTAVTVAVREATVRKALQLKKREPLIFRGLTVRCVGSLRWRTEHPEVAP